MLTTEQIQLDAQVRSKTDPHALFLSSAGHHDPLMMLAGRRLFMGYWGQLWVSGIPYQQRQAEVKDLLQFRSGTEARLTQEKIDYVLISTTDVTDPATIVDRWLIPAGLFLAAWLVYAWVNNGRTAGLDYFRPLADAFLHGRLGLTEAPSYLNELVPGRNGLYWVVYPPAPALVMIPAIVFFGPDVHQEWISILLGAANVVLASWILEGMGVRRGFRVVMSLAFAFGTIVWFSAQVGNSWHFAHVVAIFFMLL